MTDNYLPPALSPDLITKFIVSLDLPTPISIEPLKVTAAFHSIYLVHFPATATTAINTHPNPDGTLTLVLRVSGRQLPCIKTRNEVGVMAWVRQNTQIPLPAVIRYDDTENNLLGHEFTLLEKAPGVSVDKVYDNISIEARTKMVHQLADFLIELHTHPFTDGLVGGLTLCDGQIKQGPPIDEWFWQVPDLEKYWAEHTTGQTLETLNPIPPDGFSDYVAWTVGCLERYIHAIQIHPSLETYRDLIPRIQAFIAVIQEPQHSTELNQVTHILAHKDMHFANIMCDPNDPECSITAVLDWEFSGVVPAPRWNPPKAFLWNGQMTSDAKNEQTRMMEIFQDVCREKGAGWILDQMPLNARQDAMQHAVNHIRAIVEVCPRGQAQDRVAGWREEAEKAMKTFGV